MTHFVYIFFVLFISFFCELFFGLYGIVIPFIAATIFYLTIVYNFKVGFSLAIICGIVIDTVYGRTFFVSPLTLAAISVFSIFWLKKGVVKNLHLQLIPGATISLIYILPIFSLTYFLHEKGFSIFFINFLLILLEVIMGSILLLIIIFILDSLNLKLKLKLYSKSKELDEQ